MTPEDLERYLHDHIPLSKAMQVSVLAMSAGAVQLGAPLAPNINHRETVFGGSASALAILSAWSLLHLRLRGEGQNCRLVIQRNSMAYERPILGGFTARATLDLEADWNAFLRMLTRKGMARLTVPSVLECDGQVVGHFSGDFVAIARSRDLSKEG